MDKNTEKAVWGIHGTDDSIFLKENKIVLGWKDFGDLSKVESSRESFKEHYQKSFPKGKKGAIGTCSGMLHRFIHEIKIGDYIVYPSKTDRMINIALLRVNIHTLPKLVNMFSKDR